jgi:hypothetical protein
MKEERSEKKKPTHGLQVGYINRISFATIF